MKKKSAKKSCSCSLYEIHEIHSKLKRGDVSTIALKTWYSQSHVSNVLAGRRKNADIVNAAKTMTMKRK